MRAGGAANLIGSRSYTYSVPIFALPGRHGFNVNLSLVYNSLLWEGNATGSVTYNPDTGYNFYTPSPGFRLDFGSIIWSTGQGTTSSGVFFEPSGAKHTLVDISGNGTLFHTVDST